MKRRLPRKRKKWLKKFGGWEYWLQVPPKNTQQATEDDFKDIMDSLGDMVIKYHGHLVEINATDSGGLKWHVFTSAERINKACLDVFRNFKP